MHCNGSRPNQDHIKRQRSIKKGEKRVLGKALMFNAYVIINIKYGTQDDLSYENSILNYNIFEKHF